MIPFGLRNAADTVSHLVAQHMIPPPTNDEFMGVIEHITESFHDLLAEDLEPPSGSDSSRGSHHPFRECFMTGSPKGHVESVHEEEATPVNDLDDEVQEETAAPPCMRVEQLKSPTPRDRGSVTLARAGMRVARSGDRAPQRWL